MPPIESASIDAADIAINKRELASRLKMPLGFKNEPLEAVLDSCESEFKRVCDAKYFYASFDIGFPAEGEVDFGFARFVSNDLYKNLKNCRKAHIFAVTLGMTADRALSAVRAVSPSKAFVLDAVCSAAAEAAADFVSGVLGKSAKLRPRYSPGYGDLSLEVQRDILKELKADKILGIKLGENLLMTPSKSITAIQGIIPE